MEEEKVLVLLDAIFLAIFRQRNPFSLDQIQKYFAHGLDLPIPVYDSTTGETT